MYVERLPEGFEAEGAARALAGRPGLAWLDGEPSHAEGRWSYVASDPVEVRSAALSHPAPLSVLGGIDEAVDGRGAAMARCPRWIGYLGYDATWAAGTRRPPRHARDVLRPVVWMGRYDAVVAVDGVAGEAWLVGDDRAACARLRRLLEAPGRTPRGRATGELSVPPREEHARAVEAALAHIAAGDVYQVNLARRFRAGWEGDPLALWLAMRQASPVPLGMFVDAGASAVLARTMETFVDWEGLGGRLSTRPIKGTIARSGGDDEAEARALRSDDKERAEHAMIVDLMRNDLGRVARTGTVRVERLMDVEPFAALSHLVSTVACVTREDVRLADILAATFPPGSVTGAPKVRAMEIIESLEPHPRGVYCGCVGAVDRAGGARFAVAIRTAEIAEGVVTYHAGGGLVSASIPEREVRETELKARVFLDALEALERAAAAPACTPHPDRVIPPP